MITLLDWMERAEVALGVEDFGEEKRIALRSLAVQAEALWPELDPSGRATVVSTLHALGERLDAYMRHIEGELARCAQRRAGVRGYGRLQTCHLGQRLRRRA